jgi:hypothetical protein
VCVFNVSAVAWTILPICYFVSWSDAYFIFKFMILRHHLRLSNISLHVMGVGMCTCIYSV